jgi:hypothetical protein
MIRNTQIPHRKLTLPTAKQVGVSTDLVLALMKTQQLTNMEIYYYKFTTDNYSKAERINSRFLSFSSSCSIMRIVSSVYGRIESPPSKRCGIYSFYETINLCTFDHSRKHNNHYFNSIGDRGSPSRRPFNVWKDLPMSSLTFIAILPPYMKELIKECDSSEKGFHSECLLKKRLLHFVIWFLKILLLNNPIQYF